MTGSRTFPKDGIPVGTPPLFTPEAWAVRYMSGKGVGGGREKWKKYAHRHAANLGIRSTVPMMGGVVKWMDLNGAQRAITGVVVVEVWQYVTHRPLATEPDMARGTWVLVETQVHRTNDKTNKREVFVS